MTPLQKHIHQSAINFIKQRGMDYFLEAFKHTEGGSIYVPFQIDGVIDYLLFDNHRKRFTKIRYQQGVGDGANGEFNAPFTAYFDDVEFVEIDFEYDFKHG